MLCFFADSWIWEEFVEVIRQWFLVPFFNELSSDSFFISDLLLNLIVILFPSLAIISLTNIALLLLSTLFYWIYAKFYTIRCFDFLCFSEGSAFKSEQRPLSLWFINWTLISFFFNLQLVDILMYWLIGRELILTPCNTFDIYLWLWILLGLY